MKKRISARAGVLREALVRAAHACLWIEEQSVWGEHTPEVLTHARDRRRAQARVERVLAQGTKERFLTPVDQRRLLGVVLDAMTEARWRHEPRFRAHAKPWPDIEAQLIGRLRHEWTWALRRQWMRQPWRQVA
jgi:hypothetical protein